MAGIPYSYTALEKEPHQIRILTLLPGTWEDDIDCRLHEAFLADNPAYEALSYAWGDPNDKKEIRLDGHIVKVTSNLELALRYLRLPFEELSLWVDALCIDQNNNNEKSHQVGLMDEVYKQCSTVKIFLGHEDSVTPVVEEQIANQPRKVCPRITKTLKWISSGYSSNTTVGKKPLRRASDYGMRFQN